ncbi:FAD linked oxidase domain protein [Rippkaea orientalis PCC 8801]|uniref:FAD linked oxidase domain protein n=1 Tax=Rippkaea orientalis (strain PCC 8801 / RF-1) TaxID=41431 RepID=B7JZ86_RIPO1|nr:FAD-binding oxidoreductase [Rippkaea orientalis]ACK67297.1 FAD linked oxidase domain protein [Rippkaea orientalis PCC 8801]
MNLRFRREIIAPWALRPTIQGLVYRPTHPREVPLYLSEVKGSLTVRGNGRSYGDVCVNPGGYHLNTLQLNKFLEFDDACGRLTCQAGVTLEEITALTLPKGWFLAVTPGTAKVTVGGCIGCDVHGKNHHHHGSFASTVLDFEIVTAQGLVLNCSRTNHQDLFWATVGGLGQTGVITRVTLQLMRVESAWMKVCYLRTKNLDETLELQDEYAKSTYSIAWIDSLARGQNLGRGIIMLGEHATLADLSVMSPSLLEKPLTVSAASNWNLPFFAPSGLFGSHVWKLFNQFYYQKHPNSAEPCLVDCQKYFYPADGVGNWNRIYGRRGFIEYQIAVSLAKGHEILRYIVEKLSRTGNGSFMAGLKCFGPGNCAPLSFPMEGYTLAVDMPVGNEQQGKLLAHLDELVAEAGGRVYFAKDSRLIPHCLPKMYPRYREWLDVVNQYDPNNLFSSGLVKRLGLRP